MTSSTILAAGCAVALASLTCVSAQAQTAPTPAFYANLGGGFALEDQADTLGILGRAGYRTAAPGMVRPFITDLAYEGEAFIGIFGEEEDGGGGERTGKVDYMLSGSVKASRRITGPLEGFARLGVARTSKEVEVDFVTFGSQSDRDSDTGVLFGFGAEYRLNAREGIRGDYSFQNDIDAFSLAYSRFF